MADDDSETWPVYLLRGDDPLDSSRKIKQWMKRLTKEQERLVQLVPALEGASEVANLRAADALREWHLGRLEEAALLTIQDDAMALTERSGKPLDKERPRVQQTR